MKNCGIEALENIAKVENISAFTLIHLAKDNGLKLKICKVKEKDLTLVHRPAIFHSVGHFEFIKNGEALPELKWTGYVLTQKSIGRPISFKEAKEVTGSGPVAALVGIVVKAVSVTASFLGTGLSAIPGLGGIGAGFSGLGTGLAGASASLAAGNIGAGLAGLGKSLLLTKTGGALIGAGVGGAKGGIKGALTGAAIGGLAGGAAGNFSKGFAAAKGGTLGARLASGARSTFGVANPAVSGAAPTGVAGIPTPEGLVGTATIPGVGQAPLSTVSGGSIAAGGVGSGLGTIGTDTSRFRFSSIQNFNPELTKSLSSTFNAGLTPVGATKTLGGNIEKGLENSFQQAGAAGAVQLAGSALGPKAPSGIDFDPAKEFSVLRDFLGDNALPAATEQELVRLVKTPLSELTSDFTSQNDKTFRRLNDAFDNQISQVERRFSQSGQNRQNSSELRDTINEIENNRATSLTEAQQEINSETTGRAIQAKQYALTRSLEKDIFDNNLALELANVIGQKAALEASIQQNDFNTFQTIMADILQIGFGSA